MDILAGPKAKTSSKKRMSRYYTLRDSFGPPMTIKVHNDNDCLFCNHCTDVFWDYANGPYMMGCELDRPEISEAKTPEEHTCEMFIEEKE